MRPTSAKNWRDDCAAMKTVRLSACPAKRMWRLNHSRSEPKTRLVKLQKVGSTMDKTNYFVEKNLAAVGKQSGCRSKRRLIIVLPVNYAQLKKERIHPPSNAAVVDE
jgi:hypothetical protein